MTTPRSAMRTRRPRRAPGPGQRKIDPDRSRAALLEAALEEFAARGYSGARVRTIAERAGVSKDLVSYYFDGKAGLYAAVLAAWLDHEATFADPDLPLGDLVVRYLRDALADPRPTRLLAWRGLTADPPAEPAPGPAAIADLSSTTRRQDTGELAADLDPATLRLVLLAAVAAPVILPTMAYAVFGTDPSSPDFETRYAKGLRELVRHLSPPGRQP